MSIEIILLGVIIVLAGLLGFEKRESRLERNKLINALIARSAQEQVNLDLADKTIIKNTTKVETKPDLIPESELDDETFDKYMKGELGA